MIACRRDECLFLLDLVHSTFRVGVGVGRYSVPVLGTRWIFDATGPVGKLVYLPTGKHPWLSLSLKEHTEIVFLGYEIFHLDSHLRRPEDQTGGVHTTHTARGGLHLIETWCLSSQLSSPHTRACSWGNLCVHSEKFSDRAV
jgi:hypothetical protein